MENRDSAFVVWREMLSGLFSTLGRMARLADCYDPQTCCYAHDKVAEQLGLEEADRALRIAHQLVWADWMRGSLEQQQADVHLYLIDGSPDIAQMVAIWRESQPFLSFIPTSAKAGERTLFISHLGIILELLSNRHGAESAASFETEDLTHPVLHQQLIGLIREQYSHSDLSLKGLGTRVHLSERHLGRLFTSYTGQTFRQYLRDLRITEAAKLLADSSYNVKAIAALVGYHDRSHFGEDFRHVMGCTPVEFRAKGNDAKVTVPTQTDAETAPRRCPIS